MRDVHVSPVYALLILFVVVMWCNIHLLEVTARACFLFVGLTKNIG